MEKNNLNIRSDEVQDIMQRTPSWIVRWGISIFFIIIIVGLFLTWLIKYPEIINGTVKLTTRVSPIKITSQTSGKLTQLYVNDGEEVKAGKVLAEIENPLSVNGIKYIDHYLELLDKAITSGQSQLPLPNASNIPLGDLQSVFNDLQKDITAFNLNKLYKMDDVQMEDIRKHLAHQKELLDINNKMLAIAKRDMENASTKYESDLVLFKNNVISKQEFFQKQTEYGEKQLQLERLQQSKIQNEVLINSLQLQLSEGIYNKNSKYIGTLESIQSHQKIITNYIYGWQQKYRLIAACDGKISYLSNLQPNHFLKADEEVFALFQPDDAIIALAEVPMAGFGKVKVGQKVNLMIDNYPHYDYGILIGNVSKIALLPNSNFYRVEIILPDGMKSTQGKILKFTPEMVGMAEIITDDKTVMQRIFKSFFSIFQKK